MKLHRLLLSATAALVVGFFGASLRAADGPHWNAQSVAIDCSTGCHGGHGSPGSTLTAVTGNANLCQSCHVASGLAKALPVNTADKANLNTDTGIHHAWDVAPVHAGLATSTPTNPAWSNRLSNGTSGNIICSTCHDQHSAKSVDGGLPRISPAAKTTALTSPLITSGGPTPAPPGAGTSSRSPLRAPSGPRSSAIRRTTWSPGSQAT